MIDSSFTKPFRRRGARPTPLKLSRRRWLTIATVLLFFGSNSAAALQIASATVGWSGAYKLGRWTPIVIQFQVDEPQSGKLVISALDGEGIQFDTTIESVSLTEQESTVTAYLRLGINRKLKIRFVSEDDQEKAEFILGVPDQIVTAWQQLVVSIGSDIDIEQALRGLRRAPNEAVIGVRIRDVTQLPDRWIGYDGVDAVFMCTSDLGWWNSLSQLQKRALVEWVAKGGRILLSIAKNAKELTRDESILSAWKPGPFLQLTRQRQTSALEELGETSVRLDLLAQDAVGRFEGIQTAVFGAGDGVVTLDEGFGKEQSDWVIRRAYGLGIVKLLLADIDQPPFANGEKDRNWPATNRLVARLIEDLLPGKPAGREDVGGRINQSQLGYRDLTGQLRAALDKFPGVCAAPFALVAGLAGIYVLLIGPVDYFLLRRLGRRMRWTWVTFPLLALGMCLSISFLARQWKGTSLVLNQVHLVDIAIDLNQYRATSWAHIFTPRTEKTSVELKPNQKRLHSSARNEGELLSWQGLPGHGFGGMSAPSHYGTFLEPYQIHFNNLNETPQAEIRNLAMPKWSSRAFSSNWWGTLQTKLEVGNVQVTADGVLTGTFKNPLDVVLSDCAVCFGRWYYAIGRLGPGEEFSFDGAQHQDLRSRLMRCVIFDGSKELNAPWDPESDDLSRIMEMYMFHDAAGGRETYTELLHRYDGNLDMSQLIQLRRAVVYGRIEGEICDVLCLAQTRMAVASATRFVVWSCP